MIRAVRATRVWKILLLTFLAWGCTGIPDGITPVEDFALERYLGKWYEIARLDHSFERGLTRVTAEYRRRADGGVKVINRGFAGADNKWQEAEGKAYFVNTPDQGYLKVSFFGPFYGAYVIIELDHDNYSYALVSGPDRSYLWLLSRTPAMDDKVKNALIARAAALGYATDRLIFVDHGS